MESGERLIETAGGQVDIDHRTNAFKKSRRILYSQFDINRAGLSASELLEWFLYLAHILLLYTSEEVGIFYLLNNGIAQSTPQ